MKFKKYLAILIQLTVLAGVVTWVILRVKKVKDYPLNSVEDIWKDDDCDLDDFDYDFIDLDISNKVKDTSITDEDDKVVILTVDSFSGVVGVSVDEAISCIMAYDTEGKYTVDSLLELGYDKIAELYSEINE